MVWWGGGGGGSCPRTQSAPSSRHAVSRDFARRFHGVVGAPPCVRVRATLSRPLGYTTRLARPPSHRETINTFSCVFTVVHGTNTGLCFFALIYSPKRRRWVMACLVHIGEATDLSGHEFQATTWLVYTCPCPGHRRYKTLH